MKVRSRDIMKSVFLAKENKLFDKLNDIYDRVEQGVCEHCNKCCSEDVDVSFLEFINIYNYLKANNMYEEYSDRAIKYYMKEFIYRGKCPFLKDNRCSIYTVRPLTCRNFGHLSKEDYEANYGEVLNQNKNAAKEFKKQYGVNISDKITEFKIPYCEDFKKDNDQSLLDNRELISSIFQLDIDFLEKELLNYENINTSLCGWFAYIRYSKIKAINTRVAVTQWYLNCE